MPKSLQEQIQDLTLRMIQIEEWRRNADPSGQLFIGLAEWKIGMNEWRREQKAFQTKVITGLISVFASSMTGILLMLLRK